MSLLDTFVQVFEFDTQQADDAFNRVSKSTDDIIAEMKKAQQSATMGADGFTQFIQNLSAQLTELSSNSVDINVNSDTSGVANNIIAEIERIKESANTNADEITNVIQSVIDNIGNIQLDDSLDIDINTSEAQQKIASTIEELKSLKETILSTGDNADISSNLIAEIESIQNGLNNTENKFSGFIQTIISQISNIPDGEITLDLNSNDIPEKITSVTSKIDELKSSMSLLDIQRDELSQGMNDSNVSSDALNAQYQQMQDELLALNNELSTLTNAEKKNREGKKAIEAILTALNADYTQFIETMRTKGIKTTGEESKAQDHLQKELSETEAKYKEAGSSVAGFATKALGAVGIVMSIGSIFAESVSRSQEIETLDKLGKKIGVATADVDAFSGAMAELGGSRESAQADLSAMANAFGNTKDSMEKVLQTADKVQGMSFDKAKKTLEGMGVSDDKTIELMMKGRKELERTMGIQKEYSGISKESIESSIKFNTAMSKFQQTSGVLKNSFLEMVIPALSKGLDWLTKFISFCKENKNLLIGFFSAVGLAVALYYVPPMIAAASATLAATWPIIAIIAIIALLAVAFAIVYDDIMNFIDGNDSMIGRILEKYPRLKIVILALWETFKKLFEYLKVIVGVVADIVVAGWDLMASGLKAYVKFLINCISVIAGWGKSFAGVFTAVTDAVVGAFEWMWEQVKKIIGWVNTGLDAVKNGWKSAKEFFGFGDDEEITVNQNVERKVNDNGEIEYAIPQEKSQTTQQPPVRYSIAQANAQLDAIANNAMNPITSQAISNRSSVKNENNLSIGEIKIETQATDAQGIASETKDALQDQLADFNQQNSTGVAK
ncbi:hypothetical protein JEP40_13865 [Proteus vulgaris]|uniref:hypothetical protein n=1 Tax=Proteus vulgaris TaxID=585 RepID=UPI0018E4CB88|nr:hypothetical protein [Proteus vulgaris]MBI6530195.1 hypothetical protein [Proteus vulgaris]